MKIFQKMRLAWGKMDVIMSRQSYPEHESLYTYLLSYLDGVENTRPNHLKKELLSRLEKIQNFTKLDKDVKVLVLY